MLPTERRRRFREHLAGNVCLQPASVFDPLSARLADALGFEIGMFAGSVASAVVLGAPDIAVLSLPELAAQAARVTRTTDISLLVDADHGYGNALGAMRTVRELEEAGVSALTLEDTALPLVYGSPGENLISTDEMVAKLRAALEARTDPQTVVVGRTHALRTHGIDEATARVKAFAATGVDAIFVVSASGRDDLRAIGEAAGGLPLMLGGADTGLTDQELAALGVRIVIRGHATLQASVKAIHDVLSNQAQGKPASEVRGLLAPSELMDVALGTAAYDRLRSDYLG